ncbi:NAD(P)H-hydrate epimerase [Corynebacterium halotolerans]|uniref:NAD(P)H-hydrate epimerase n=1 Tax=Corynebacterium halotolerans TaxID=225326 RepID=UPI003CE9EEA2
MTQEAIDQAVEQVPLTLPEGKQLYGWIVNQDLATRIGDFGPLRDGIHSMAARAIADLTEAMIDSPLRGSQSPRILLLVGQGGNGADGLRAGVLLAQRGRPVDVMILGSPHAAYAQEYPEDHPNRQLLTELLAAGGTVITGAHVIEEDIGHSHGIILEAIVGSGFRGTLTGLLASWAEASGRFPSIAVDVPAGVVADTGAVPPLRSNFPDSELRQPPTLTLALGGLRRAHTGEHCGMVFLASCGLELGREWPESFGRLISPAAGFEVPCSVDAMTPAYARPPEEEWREVRPAAVNVVVGESDCLGFGLLVLQTLRGAGTWHRLGLLAEQSSLTPVITRHPDVDVHLDLDSAAAQPPDSWIVETRDAALLREVLLQEQTIILGPRAADTVAGTDLVDLLQHREAKTILITRDAGHDALSSAADVIRLGERNIHTSSPHRIFRGRARRRHEDPVVPLTRVQGIEAVVAGLRAVAYSYTLIFLADRMQRLAPHWPVSAVQLAAASKRG